MAVMASFVATHYAALASALDVLEERWRDDDVSMLEALAYMRDNIALYEGTDVGDQFDRLMKDFVEVRPEHGF